MPEHWRLSDMMHRQDTTSLQYQLQWKGTHRSGNGCWTYPRIESGRMVKGTTYLACNCGWRLVHIGATPTAQRHAGEQYNQHICEITDHRANIVKMRRRTSDV